MGENEDTAGRWLGTSNGVEVCKTRVLLVIPSDIERRGLRLFVEQSGRYEVVGAADNGQAALVIALEAAPHIAIIQYSLPDMTGLGLSHLLTHFQPRIEVLLQTDRLSEDGVIEALREGVRGFLLRSSAALHLTAALDALSEHRPYWEGAVEEEVFTRLVGGPLRTSNGLTARERQVIQLLAEGHSTKEMAFMLNVSAKTIETYRIALRRKLRVRTVADLVRYAIDNGIIER
jgi:DNA-binding NarL/FixJ family response regulator